MAAAESGSARVVRALLTVANNADELMIPVKMHALHGAAKNGHTEVIKVGGVFTIFDIQDFEDYIPIQSVFAGPSHCDSSNREE